MGKIIFIIGGSRSGKSRYAVELAEELGGKIAFIATCISPDKEMKERIRLHKKSRPTHWKVIEEGKDVDLLLTKLRNKYKAIIVDCMGLLISNLLVDGLSDNKIQTRIEKVIWFALKANFITIVVSNEVGAGVVPRNALARRFRDLAGSTNQMIAKKADEVIFMQAGIPVKIKGGK